MVTLRTTLCESTVEMARMAPSDVDIEAAQMPISTQQPRNVGICGERKEDRLKHLGCTCTQVLIPTDAAN